LKLSIYRLKIRVANEINDKSYTFTDTAILRFYRGRQSDEEKAFKALGRHLQWRKENNVDEIASDTSKFEEEMNSGKIVVDGFDHHGHPSIFIYARKHNKHKRDLEQMRLLIIYTLETILKKANPAEERILYALI